MMDGPFVVFALLVLALAIYSGLMAIATAITKLRISSVDVRFPEEINVIHRGSRGDR